MTIADAAPPAAPPRSAPRALAELPQLSHKWQQSYRYLRDPYTLYEDLFARHGDPVVLPTLNGTVVATGHPEGIRDIFTAEHDTFETFSPEILAPVLGPTSVLLVWGERHKRDRKLLMPPFHGARMRAYGAIMVDTTRRAAEHFVRGREFAVHETTQAISLEVILRAVFGLRDAGRIEDFRRAMLTLIGPASGPLTIIPALRVAPFGLGPWGAFLRSIAHLDGLLFRELAARRAGENADSEDILSLLLQARDEQGNGLSDAELRDELMTLVLAGHETTATALAWALYWLHRNENAAMLERVRAELDALGPAPAPDALAQLPYLNAVCSETLRLYPIVPDVPRKLRKPLVVRGVEVPAGLSVAAVITRAHLREETFADPWRFEPQRFLDRKYSPFEYLPFGGGARRCLGAAFATYELALVLATLLREHYFALARSEPIGPARRGIIMAPAHGVPLVWLGPRGALA